MANFEASVTLSCTQEAVFEFLVRPVNIAAISSPQMGLNFINAPERLELGSRLEFQFKEFGLVQHVLHEITEFDPPHRYLERQVTGPLQHWVHEHLVETNGAGRVVVTERIEFEPPPGLAGFVVTAGKILQSLKTGFEHRHQELKRLLEQASK